MNKNVLSKIINYSKSFLAFTLAIAICFCTVNVPLKVSAGATVATLSIHSDGSQHIYGWHSFLSIKNKSSGDLTILGTVVRKDKSISIATYGNQNYGPGIYTNLDAYRISKDKAFSNRVTLSTNIDKATLNKVEQLCYDNNQHGAYLNCSWFAGKVWNSVAPKYKKVTSYTIIPIAYPVFSPAALSASIKANKYHKKNGPLGTCDKNNIRRVIDKKTFVKVDPKYIAT